MILFVFLMWKEALNMSFTCFFCKTLVEGRFLIWKFAWAWRQPASIWEWDCINSCFNCNKVLYLFHYKFLSFFFWLEIKPARQQHFLSNLKIWSRYDTDISPTMYNNTCFKNLEVLSCWKLTIRRSLFCKRTPK